MLQTLAISNYRSLLNLVLPLSNLNVVTGANGSGKSNLYKALRLLAETAQGGVVSALAKEGGLDSTFWAGPEKLSKGMRDGGMPIQGGPRQEKLRLRLGFSGEDFNYAISLGLPVPGVTFFNFDPEIKHECIWVGRSYRPSTVLIERNRTLIKVRDGKDWRIVSQHAPCYESIFTQIADPTTAPEVINLREQIRSWRFYDHFRTDADASVRSPQLGTRTPVLHHDGRDLAAALRTIIEIGDQQALHEAVADAFPGAKLQIDRLDGGRFAVLLRQDGLLRPLTAQELSDGTLRYMLWVAALLTPRPPPLMILNEPENSLHPDLLPALAKLIRQAAKASQIWVVSHSTRLVASLEQDAHCNSIALEKNLGRTQINGQGMLDAPAWKWPD